MSPPERNTPTVHPPDTWSGIDAGETPALPAAESRALRLSRWAGRHFRPVAVITLLVVALFWRVFFLGETLIDVATLDNQLPWGYYAGEQAGSAGVPPAGSLSGYAYNRRDLTDTYVTREYFVAQAYQDGEWPLWNPYSMAGHPIHADGVTRTLSPSLLFYRLFDVPFGYSIARIAELLLAAIFLYFYLVAIGAGRMGGVTGAIIFAFSSHSMLHLTGLGWWGGLMWLPLIFLAIERAVSRSSYGYALLGGVFVALQLFSGYLPNQIYYIGAVVLYYGFHAGVRAFEARRRKGAPPWSDMRRLVMMALVTVGVGLVLAASQWVPVLELLQHSNRRIVPTESGYIYLPPWYLLTLIFPNMFGAAYDAKMTVLFAGLNVSHDHILYLGIAALLPLGAAVACAVRAPAGESSDRVSRLRLRFFTGLAVFSLLVIMTAPIYVHITRYIPVLQTIRVIVRAGVLFLFAASVLAGLGVGVLSTYGSEQWRRAALWTRRLAVGSVVFVVVAIAGSYTLVATGFAVDLDQRGKIAFIRRAAEALSAQFQPPGQGILVPLLLVALLSVTVWLVASRRLEPRLVLVGLVALLTLDLFWNSRDFNPTFDDSRVFPATRTTDTLASLPPGRVLVTPSDLESNRRAWEVASHERIIAPPNTLLPYRIPVVTGKDQLFPRWYREFGSLIEPQPYLSHVVFDSATSPLFDLLNVRYVVTHSWRPPPENHRAIAEAEGLTIYENAGAMARAFLVRVATPVSTREEALGRVAATGFDPRVEVVIESSGPIESLARDPALLESEVSIIEDGRNHVIAQSRGREPAWLVLSDNYYPGWRASIDGQPVEIYRANGTMRAVRVPAGDHVISFEFKPAVFWYSISFSTAAAALLLTFVIISGVRTRRFGS